MRKHELGATEDSAIGAVSQYPKLGGFLETSQTKMGILNKTHTQLQTLLFEATRQGPSSATIWITPGGETKIIAASGLSSGDMPEMVPACQRRLENLNRLKTEAKHRAGEQGFG